MAFSSSVFANTYTPTTFTDPIYTTINNANGSITAGGGVGLVSLRSAIQAAENTAGSHTITLSAGTYGVTNGEITLGDVVNETITFNGVAVSPPTSIINMAGNVAAGLGGTRDRIFFINTTASTAGILTTFNNIKFTGGNLSSDPYGGGAIRAGGPSNVLTLNNCVFENNTLDPANGGGTTGGAINISGGGAVNINSCTFTNNINPDADGGAVYYFFANNAGLTGSLTISNSIFSNNKATNSSGGAIGIAAQGNIGGRTFSVSISHNSFENNSAQIGSGGAIIANNGDATYPMSITYNRFMGNSSLDSTSSGLGMNSAAGSVHATNNWWSSNTGPGAGGVQRAAVVGGASVGTLDLNTWLQLRNLASPNPILTGGVTTVTADIFGLNSGGPVAAANLVGLPKFPSSPATIFSTPVLGVLSGAGTQFVNGQVAATFTAGTVGGNGSASAVADSQTVIAGITIDQPPLITNANSSTFTTGSAGLFKIAASGFPAPVISVNGGDIIPGNVSFNAGTGNLSGTPTNGTGGIYLLHFTATNVAGTNSQTFTLTVNQAPAINSATTTAFLVGSAGTFTVTASGFPTPTFARAGVMPGTLAFNTNSGVLNGTPAIGTGGTYPMTFTAHNGVGSDATQNFSLVVNQSPAIICPSDILTNGAFGACQLPAVSFASAATGAPSPSVSYKLGASTITSPYVFPLGTNSVSSTATNVAGTISCNFLVVVQAGPAPQLSVLNNGTNVLVSWPGGYSCYTLQTASELSSNIWNNYSGPAVTNGGTITVTNGVGATNRFFRLSF